MSISSGLPQPFLKCLSSPEPTAQSRSSPSSAAGDAQSSRNEVLKTSEVKKSNLPLNSLPFWAPQHAVCGSLPSSHSQLLFSTPGNISRERGKSAFVLVMNLKIRAQHLRVDLSENGN